MSVDSIATKFLKNFENLKLAVVPAVSEPEVVQLEDTHCRENVIVAREKEPRFYAGTVGKGDRQRAVWVHDIKQARHVDGYQLHLYEDRLGVELFPLWPYA